MISDLNLGVSSFCASLHKIDECEINGLPRLPYSVNIIGKFEELKALYHPNICQYLDAKRDKHERIVIATECFNSNFFVKCPDINNIGKLKCVELFYRLVSAIEYLHNSGIIIRNLSSRNIFWSNDENIIKLVNYGLYYMTNCGMEIDFIIGYLPYLSPESLLDIYSREKTQLSCPRSDVWSVGILILQCLSNGSLPKLFNDLNATAKNILDCFLSKQDIISLFDIDLSKVDQDLLNLAKKCLKSEILERISIPDLKEELGFILKSLSIDIPVIDQNNNYYYINNNNNNNSNSFDGNVEEIFNRCIEKNREKFGAKQKSCPVDFFETAKERYYFWTLTGGDLWRPQDEIEGAADEERRHRKLPSILTVPVLIRTNGEECWPREIAHAIHQPFSDTVIPLQSHRLTRKIAQLAPRSLNHSLVSLPPLFQPFDFSPIDVTRKWEGSEGEQQFQIRSQPVWVKEKDFEYQLRRVLLFRRLLRGYPLTERSLFKEASFDIPPLLRSEIWPLLLGIDHESAFIRYTKVQGVLLEDKAASQITVDLPRCHSYDELIVSSAGQGKLSRVLHAWLLHHSYLEYTQGMDSLCAVFVRLLFNQEAIAFACLEAFVNKFMRGLFCVSHGQALNEYCMVLQQLLAFHKPHLSKAINIFNITGFTASWIYTGFAHSLSLDKTLRLWDTVILGEPSFLMMIFIALLGQLDQESAFSSQATEHVFSVLSNLQEFDLDGCRIEAIDLARKTPPSVTYRSLANDSTIVPKLVDPQNICVSPRISFDDLLLIIGESNSSQFKETAFSPFSFCPSRLSTPIFIDLRRRENFQKGSLVGSKHFPIFSASPTTTFAELEALNAQIILSEYETGYKVIIGTVDDQICDEVAKVLVNRYNFQFVCILKGGINTVRSQRPDLLIVTH